MRDDLELPYRLSILVALLGLGIKVAFQGGYETAEYSAARYFVQTDSA